MTPEKTLFTVTAKRPEARDTVSFDLIPSGAPVSYRAGQFLTFDILLTGGAITRSYALSSAPSVDDVMTICVKRISGGLGSNWMVDHLDVGDTILASTPAGQFTLDDDSDAPLLFIAGGIGIVPCFSLIKQALATTSRDVCLLYSSSEGEEVVFQATLDTLAKAHPKRFDCCIWHSQSLGRLTAVDVVACLRPRDPVCYLCAPEPLMDFAKGFLSRHLGPQPRIFIERFDLSGQTNV